MGGGPGKRLFLLSISDLRNRSRSSLCPATQMSTERINAFIFILTIAAAAYKGILQWSAVLALGFLSAFLVFEQVAQAAPVIMILPTFADRKNSRNRNGNAYTESDIEPNAN